MVEGCLSTLHKEAQKSVQLIKTRYHIRNRLYDCRHEKLRDKELKAGSVCKTLKSGGMISTTSLEKKSLMVFEERNKYERKILKLEENLRNHLLKESVSDKKTEIRHVQEEVNNRLKANEIEVKETERKMNEVCTNLRKQCEEMKMGYDARGTEILKTRKKMVLLEMECMKKITQSISMRFNYMCRRKPCFLADFYNKQFFHRRSITSFQKPHGGVKLRQCSQKEITFVRRQLDQYIIRAAKVEQIIKARKTKERDLTCCSKKTFLGKINLKVLWRKMVTLHLASNAIYGVNH